MEPAAATSGTARFPKVFFLNNFTEKEVEKS